jgi:hypothetical protein
MAADPSTFPKFHIQLDHLGRGHVTVDGVVLHNVTEVKVDTGAGRITKVTVTQYAGSVEFEGPAESTVSPKAAR